MRIRLNTASWRGGLNRGSPWPVGSHRIVLLALVLCVLLAVGLAGGASGAPARRGAPELLQLLPYRLAAADLPAGFSIADESATPNAALAFQAGDGAADLLRGLVLSGRLTGLQQTFGQAADPKAAPVRFSVSLYVDASAARAAVDATDPPGADSGVRQLEVPPLGDRSRMAETDASLPDGSTTDSWIVAWSRGPLVLAVVTSGNVGTNVTDAGLPFAEAADGRAAATGAVPEPGSQLVLRGDGRELALAGALNHAQLAADRAPAGYVRGGSYLYSNDQVTLDAADPAGTVQLLAAGGRLSGAVEYFTSTDGGAVLSSTLTVYGDTGGAGEAVRNGDPPSASLRNTEQIAPDIQLGDETAAVVSSIERRDGSQRDEYRLQWRHGSVVLAVIVNVASGAPAPDFLAGVASALDAAYLAAPLVGP